MARACRRPRLASTILSFLALLTWSSSLEATGGSALGEDVVIVWDGERDVSISQGGGVTATLAELNLSRIDDYAVRVTLQSAVGRIPPIQAIRMLLRASTIDTVCGSATPPAFCSRKRRFDEAVGLERFNTIGFRSMDPTKPGVSKAALGALSTLVFELVPGEVDGIWRISAQDRGLVASIRDTFGASNVKIGFTSTRTSNFGSVNLILQDANMALPAGATFAAGSGPRAANITCLGFDPAVPTDVFACAKPVAPRVVGNTWTDNAEQTLFKSTDGGMTWEPARVGLLGEVRSVSIPFGQTLYVAAGSAIFQSSDKGVTWHSIKEFQTPGGIQRPATFVAQYPALNTVYAAFDYELFKTVNGGVAWTQVPTTGGVWPGRPIRSLTVTPAGALYVDFRPPDGGSGVPSPLLRSFDSGATWTEVPVPPGSPSGDMELMALDPQNSQVLYVRRAGWVYRSINQGATWQLTSVTGPMAVHPDDPAIVFFAQGTQILRGSSLGNFTQDLLDAHETVRLVQFTPDGAVAFVAADGRLYRSTDTGATWSSVTAGMPLAPVTDLDQASGALYAATTLTPLAKTVNGGRSWSSVSDLRRAALADVKGSHVLAVFKQSPTSMIAARSVDGGAAWTPLALPGLPQSQGGAAWAVFDPHTAGRLYASNDKQLVLSPDDGATWQVPVASLDLSRPAFSHVPGTFYAAGFHTSGYGLWKTTNGGATWTRLSSLTLSSATVFVAHGTQASYLYVAEGRRVHRSTDGGNTWTSSEVLAAGEIAALSVGLSLSSCSSTGCVLNPPPVYVGTDRGVFVGDGSTWVPYLPLHPAGAPFSRVTSIVANPPITFGTDAGIWTFDPLAQVAYRRFDQAGGYGLLTLTGVASSEITIDVPWIRLITPKTIGGDATILFRVDAHTDAAFGSRTGYVIVAGRAFAVNQAPAGCTYAVSTSSVSVASGAASGTVTVTTAAGCGWTALSNAEFITVAGTGSFSGTATIAFNVGANPATTARSGTMYIAGETVAVSQAASSPPTLSLSKTTLRFTGLSNGAQFVTQTPAESVRLTQNGVGSLQWVATSDRPWLVLSPAASTGSGTLDVFVQFVNGLPLPGTTTGTVTISATGGQTGTLGTIAVTLDVVQHGTSSGPIGAFDTPVDKTAGVAGSIPVTGWAADDVGIVRVRIMRDPVAGESPVLQFIGNATRVEGARPDIVALYGTRPEVTRSGWGYLMLTNFLPNRGTGTFTLRAYADDVEGNTTLLGTKTITCSNDTSLNPFGAIDTPDQGATIGGASPNFGWVLSPGERRADPPGGGTVTVLVDGIAVGSPGLWQSRSDLSSLFPESLFKGIGTAMGVHILDTRALSNGVHTIAWTVKDDAGGTAGIGSRYFTVSNGLSLTAASTAALVRTAGPGVPTVVRGRRGFDLDAPLRTYQPVDGVITVHAEEVDRIELHVGASTGLMRTGTTAGALPIGAHLDPDTGIFTWQPGPGFVGVYDFSFGTDGTTNVRVVLNPKGSGRVGRQLIIDTPAESQTRHVQPFLVAGWAADLDADMDTGIGPVHIWAYPAGGGPPIFLGSALDGISRPDVAAVYGERFRSSGYGLLVEGLAAGTYDIAVFGFSTAMQQFMPAKLVRVSVE
jgi:photosystem II stability/assembly factor-like uncharacterized protein